jgi:hypothetical protein
VRGLPERLPRKIREYFGAAGQLWLDNLPERILRRRSLAPRPR